MERVEVPSFFLCPISLQIMRDPVTLSTGITYDRESIEQWIFTGKHNSCPITKQSLSADCDLITTNHTLRRLIQAWCTSNASNGIERFPTACPPVDKAQISDLIHEAKSQPKSLMNSLRKLKSIIAESESNKRCVESSDAVDFLVSVIESNNNISNSREEEEAIDEALNILYSLQFSKQGLLDLVKRKGGFMEILVAILQRSNYQSREHATLLLKSLLSVISPVQLMGLRDDLFQVMMKVLKDHISYKATKAALQVLSKICPWRRNKVTAVEARVVSVLIDLLLEEPENKVCEMMLVILARLSRYAEGRAAIIGHAAGIAVVSKKMVRVSAVASERAVRIMHSVAKFSPTPAVLREMLELGVVSKLCLLIQVDCEMKTKEKVKEILRLHSRVWKNSRLLVYLLSCRVLIHLHKIHL